MHTGLLRRLLPFLILLAGSPAGIAQPDPRPEVSEQALAALTRTIADVQAEIGRRNKERSGVLATLQATEKSLAAVNAEITDIEADIQANRARLADLQAQSKLLAGRKQDQQRLIGQYLRSAYRTGQQEYLKLLLNQEDPALASRTLAYYRYFSEARRDRITAFNATLADIAAVSADIAATTETLDDQQAALAQKQATLRMTADERQVLLDELDVQLTRSNKKLADLEAQREEMELLIEELRRSIANLSLGDQQQPFAKRRGQLPWPVEGPLKNRWGETYGNGDLNWQGVTIAARAGGDVRAIHHGRVVFADWFSSSGLLLIIDHGDGYMSLYAHNQALFKDVGEWVNSGEVIAAVGNTGGQEEVGLYFEIRHNGESINPSTWCLARH